MRQEKNGIRYFSFQEIPDMPQKEKHTYGAKKKEKFLGLCRICKAPLSYISGTNVIACTNEKCNGFSSKKNKDEENNPNYVYKLLDEKGIKIATKLFGDD